MPSIAGMVGSTIWAHNPLMGMGLAFGAVVGGMAAVNAYSNTEGSISDKTAAARDSGLRSGILGTVGVFGALTVANIGARPIGYAAGRMLSSGPGMINNYAKGIQADFIKGRAGSGLLGGISRVAERKVLMGGIGAAVGAAIGHAIDSENPNTGALVGAGVGGASGLAISTGIRGSRLLGKFGVAGRLGALGVLSATAFGAATILSHPKNAGVDIAQPENNGLNSRMNSMNATGDLVFGLHRSR